MFGPPSPNCVIPTKSLPLSLAVRLSLRLGGKTLEQEGSGKEKTHIFNTQSEIYGLKHRNGWENLNLPKNKKKL